MKRLNNFKNIADDVLENMTVTEDTKLKIKQAARSSPKASYSKYRSITAFVAAAVLILSVVSVSNLLPSDSSSAEKNIEPVVMATTQAAMGTIDEAEINEKDHVDTQNVFYSLTPLSESETGIASDTDFLLTTDDYTITAASLKEMISISNGGNVAIEQKNKGEFILKTDENFRSNSIVNVNLDSDHSGLHKSWVFQTESQLTVTRTFPTADSAGQPVNGGIEISFSGYVTESFEENFSIYPEVSGHFEYYGKTAVFVPDQPLSDATVYTVKLEAGIVSKTGEVLASEYVYSFKTQYGSVGDLPYLSGSISETFIPDDPVLIEVYANSDYDNTDVSISLYQFDSIASYREAASYLASVTHPQLSRIGEALFDTQNLKLYDSYSLPLHRTVNDPYGATFIVFPKSLPNGWYLADILFEDGTKLQKLIQISPISAFMLNTSQSAAIWVNSTVSGKPIASESVRLDLGPSVYETKTDSSGVAIIDDISSCTSYALLNIGSSFTEIVSLNQYYGNYDAYTDRYLIIYTDREAYLPTDTVKLWGTIYNKTEASPPVNLTVEIGNSKNPEAVFSIMPLNTGSFSLEIPLKNHLSGYLEYRILDGDIVLYTSNIYITEYDKPIYTLETELNKAFYRHDEEIVAELQAKYYDGTPAQGLKIAHYSYEGRTDAVTDQNGIAEFQIPVYHSETDWYPQYKNEYFITLGAEDVSVHAYADFYYFPTDYMLTVSQQDDGTLLLSSNAIDFDAYDPSLPFDADAVRGVTSTAVGTVELYQCRYEQEYVGDTYDFINKVNVPQYNYEYVETLLYNEAFETENGVYQTSGFDFSDDETVWYRYAISYTGEDGVDCFTNHYVNSRDINFESVTSLSYGDSNFISVRYDTIFTLPVLHADGKIAESGKLLNLSVTDKIVKYVVSEGNTYTDMLSEDLIPNFHLSGAYFDGKHVFKIKGTDICIDPSDQELALSLSVPQSEYKPGETVSIVLDVLDRSGNAVSDAEFIISVTDEAAFSIKDQKYNALSSLYSIKNYPYVYSYTSYLEHSYAPRLYAEGGGEGESDGVRNEFVDNAAFVFGTTDENGQATVSFDLPDNLTSWRITAVAVKNDTDIPLAGNTSSNISTKLDYFINPVINDNFVVGDEIVFSLRTSGLKAKGTTDFCVRVFGKDENTVISSQNASATNQEFVYVNIGSLDPGSYTVLVEAQNGEYSDAVLETFTVRASSHEILKKEEIILSQPLTFDASRYPITMVLYNDEMKTYYDFLLSLYTESGNRADQKIARAKASDILSLMDPERFHVIENDLDIQDYRGVHLTSYAEDDPLLTAKALITTPEYVNKTSAVFYLNEVLSDKQSSKQDVYAAYMGLAACKEPVLNEIRYLLKTDQSNDPEIIYLYTALTLLGDYETSAAWFNSNVNVELSLTEDNISHFGDYTLLALLLRANFAETMLKKLSSFNSETYLPIFEKIQYAILNLNKSYSNAFVKMQSGDDEITYDLSERATFIVLNSTEDLTFDTMGNPVSATAIYVGGTDNLPQTLAGTASLDKTFSSFSPSIGDVVKVEVDVSIDSSYFAENDSFILYDTIPSGMRFIKAAYSSGSGWYLTSTEDNRINFVIRKPHQTNSDSENIPNTYEYTIVYYVRCALQGSFIIEPAILQNVQYGKTLISEKKVVTIR